MGEIAFETNRRYVDFKRRLVALSVGFERLALRLAGGCR
jgi:hypothetical protein